MENTLLNYIVPTNIQTILDENVAEQLAKAVTSTLYRLMKRDAFLLSNMHDQGSLLPFLLVSRITSMTLLASSRLMLRYITIDIAHGYADNVIIDRTSRKSTSFVIAGNVKTQTVRELENAGAGCY